MELRYPIGLVMLLGVGVLLWLFRRRERLANTIQVSTSRWFVNIAPKQFPQWRWWLWPLLLAGCLWYLVAAWTWTQPQRQIALQTVDVWDTGLNMPDTTHAVMVDGKEELNRYLTTHTGLINLHTNLQHSAWGDTVTLADRVHVIEEPLPVSVGVTRAGFFGNKVWVQLHNYSGRAWSGTLTIFDTRTNAKMEHALELTDMGELKIYDVPASTKSVKISIDSKDPWHWDDSYLVTKPSTQLEVQCDVKNLFLLTWSKLLDEAKNPKVIVTDTTRWSDVEKFCDSGGKVIWFPNGRSADNLKKLGITFTNETQLTERASKVIEEWVHLDGLRLLGFTTWGNSQGWDKIYWSTETDRVIIGSKRLGNGQVTAVMGPLSMPETELPSIPLFIPLMAELIGPVSSTIETDKLLRSRADSPTVTDFTVSNYDRALIQPMKGELVSSPSKDNAPQPINWEVFTWSTIIAFSLIALYSWLKKF